MAEAGARGPGRPRLEIAIEKVQEMRDRGLRWIFIAALLDVHPNTLLNWRKEHSFDQEDPLVETNDQELDEVMAAFLDSQGERGDALCRGHLLALGIRCSRERMRASIHRVDAVAREARGNPKKKRVDYNVFRPHHLWHHDGWHKLKLLAGIVVHGCIDGATRLAIYIVATDNNRADTVLDIFRHATGPEEHNQLPSRLRGDHGGENRRVAEYMIGARGLGRGSYLAGASWQNQRIESFWRFIRSQCLEYYRAMILEMSKKRRGVAQYESAHPGDRFVFQRLFLALINQELQVYISAWNNHPIRTEQSFTPRQLEYIRREDIPAPPANVDHEWYGVNRGEAEQMDDQAECHPVQCELNAERRALFEYYVKPLTMDVPKNQHVDRFVESKQYYYDLLQEQHEREQQPLNVL